MRPKPLGRTGTDPDVPIRSQAACPEHCKIIGFIDVLIVENLKNSPFIVLSQKVCRIS